MDILVYCHRDIGPLTHFWRSTGFSPASLLLNADMRQAMAYAGSIPHGGLTYIRIHYLLDLVTAGYPGTETSGYDWSVLDKALDVLVQNGLKPFFELMGNPSGHFTDFLDEGQVWAWRGLVRNLALHRIERYGLNEVRDWYFETWNEPDGHWWRGSEEAFCNYYDACSEGLKDVAPELRMGGPGTCRGLSPMLKAFLAHCDSGVNYFTGQRGVRLDFISIHEKGVQSCREDLNPDSQSIVDREVAIIDYIRRHHPRLTDVPFMNNECDPQVGWWDIHTWRGKPYYAAIACKIINQHLVRIMDELGVNYSLLSNDNGFLGGWGNRSLLARFGDIQDVRAQSEHRTKPSDLKEDPARRKFEMIKKPVLNLMALLALLGDRRCAIDGLGDTSADVGAVATRRNDGQVAVIVYHSRDKIMSSGTEPIALHLQGLPFDGNSRTVLAHYRIDEKHGDPFTAWENMGAPRLPTAGQFAEMRKHHEPVLLEEPQQVAVNEGHLTLHFSLPLPAVSLVLLSAMPPEAPGKVKGVRFERYEGLTAKDEVLLLWSGVDHRALRTYEVLYAPSSSGDLQRVNGVDTICTAFLHARDAGQSGHYKIRAVDYWGRPGEASEVVSV